MGQSYWLVQAMFKTSIKTPDGLQDLSGNVILVVGADHDVI